MTKREFLDSLHISLQKKYNLPPHSVSTIRSFALGSNWTRKQIAEWVAIKLSQPKRYSGQKRPGRRYHTKNRYQLILNFVASCSEETWKDITQKTEFDK